MANNQDRHNGQNCAFCGKPKEYAKSLVADSISTPLTWVGISLVVFAIFCAILAGFENAVKNIGLEVIRFVKPGEKLERNDGFRQDIINAILNN